MSSATVQKSSISSELVSSPTTHLPTHICRMRRGVLRAGRTLEASARSSIAGPSRLYATSAGTSVGSDSGADTPVPSPSAEPSTSLSGSKARDLTKPTFGVQYTVLGTRSPIPKLTEPGDRFESDLVDELAEHMGNLAFGDEEEAVFQPPPQLEQPTRGYLEPVPLPKTHGVPVAILHLRSYHVRLLDLFIHFALHSAISLGIPTSKAFPLPTQRRLWTVIKGPFVHKKSQENWVRLTHKRAIRLYDANPEVLDMYFSYLEKHALAGVGQRTVRWDRAPLGFGGEYLRRAIEAGVLEPEQSKQRKKFLRRVQEEQRSRGAPNPVESMVRKILKQEEKRAAMALSAAGAGAPTISGKAKVVIESKKEGPAHVMAAEVKESEPSTAGPSDFVPEPAEEGIVAEPATVQPAAAAPAASASGPVEAEQSTAGPADFVAESQEESVNPQATLSDAQELDPSTAGPETFEPEPVEDGIAAEPALAAARAEAEAAAAPAAVEVVEEAEPSTAGPAEFVPEPAEEGVSVAVGDSTEASEIPAASIQKDVDTTSAEPAVIREVDVAQSASTAGPPTGEIIGQDGSPPSAAEAAAVADVPPVSPEGTATESEVVGRDEPIDGGIATGEVLTEEEGKKTPAGEESK